WLELVQKPKTLLGVRQEQRAFTRRARNPRSRSPSRSRSVLLPHAPRALDALGELRQHRRLEQRAQRKLYPERGVRARHGLRREQRVTAAREEVVAASQ